MKRKIALVLVLLIALLGSTFVFATDDLDMDAKTNINLKDLVGEEAEENNDDLIMPISLDEEVKEGARTVSDGTRGDLFVLQNNSSIEEDVDGNLYIMADNVDIAANVYGNIFVMGRNVNIKGNIEGSAFILAENLNFVYGQVKDVYFYANNISVSEEAVILREAKMMGDAITISGSITGDMYSQAETITLSETGSITGKLVYSAKELYQANEDQIGSTEKQEIQNEEVKEKSVFVSKAEDVLYETFTALFIIGLIVLMANKNMEGKITVADSVKGVIGGIVWIIVIPVIVVLLMITLIGLPFSIILLMIYILMFFVAIPAMSLQISAYILNIKNKDSKVLLWLLAVVIYCGLAILREIPTLGIIITLLAGTYGFNLIIKTLFSKKKKEDDVINTTNA